MFIRRVANLVASVSIFSAASYVYIRHITQKNLEQYTQILQSGNLKDASRLSNESFGISWGFQADDIVMNKIDSGDYLFIKYDCSECLSVDSYLKCNFDGLLRLDEEFDCIGVAYRNHDGLYIVYNEFGQTKVRLYSQLVGLPYLQGLVIQKNEHEGIDVHLKLKKLLEGVQGVEKQKVQKFESPIQMANRFNRCLYGDDAQGVMDLRELIQTSQQILVRTETNRTLRTL